MVLGIVGGKTCVGCRRNRIGWIILKGGLIVESLKPKWLRTLGKVVIWHWQFKIFAEVSDDGDYFPAF